MMSRVDDKGNVIEENVKGVKARIRDYSTDYAQVADGRVYAIDETAHRYLKILLGIGAFIILELILILFWIVGMQ